VISAPQGHPGEPNVSASRQDAAVTVRALDVATLSGDDMAAVYEVMRLCQAEESPAEPPRTRAEAEAFVRHAPASDFRDYWLAEEDGAGIGFAQLAATLGSTAARIEVNVHPEARRRGHGTALLDAVRERARLRGVRVLIGAHATEAGRRFAAGKGAKDTLREVRSLLRLPVEAAAQPVDRYRIRSWVGPTPEELLDSFAHAREAINDAPFPSDEEREVWDGARVRHLEAALEQRERDIRVTVALDAQDEVVAVTELRVSRIPGAVANTEDTAVVAEHRREGLARWIKLESLRALQADRPDVRLVTTVNAEQNEPILALNRALGFSPVSVQTSCVLEV
jgi:mycothiol synthase